MSDEYKVSHHVKSFTYKPKIEGVKNGTITQTIRKIGKKPIREGDIISFHGWEGKPYRSKWSWRIKTRVTTLFEIKFTKGSFFLSVGKCPSIFGIIRPWVRFDIDDDAINKVAEKDGIIPSTGKELMNVLKNMGIDEGKICNIIIWEVIDNE